MDKKDLTVTRAGQKRLSSLLPQPRRYPSRWNNTWYLLSFDIPRSLNHQRDRLRDLLRQLGFGRLHDSLWIAPQNFLGDVLACAETEKFDHYLIPAISKELGRARSKDLADRVWKLKEIDMRYLNFINALEQGKPPAPQLFLEYASILRDDPFLPRPLLSEGWFGDKAHMVARKHFPAMLKEWEEEGKRLKEEYAEKDPRQILGLS